MKDKLAAYCLLLFVLVHVWAVAYAVDKTDVALYGKWHQSVAKLEVLGEDDKWQFVASAWLATSTRAVTARHCVDDTHKFRLVWPADGMRPVAKVVMDPAADYALLVFDQPCTVAHVFSVLQDLQPVGTDVWCIGYPEEFTNVLSKGFVSSYHGKEDNFLLIQTSASIQPGSSGSPLVTQNGKVVGTMVKKMRGTDNLNFALPSRYLLDINQKL